MKRDRAYTEGLLIAGLLALALLARLIPGERMVDDAYITFRYARNLIEGHGFVYNPGERVLGTTTPLYTLLMAGLALATGSRDFPALALAVNALAGAASVGLLYGLGKRVAEHWIPAAAAALLWAVAPYSITFAIGGMETDLTIALLLAVSYAHVAGRTRAMAIFSALALLARPDTAILLGLLWLDLVLARSFGSAQDRPFGCARGRHGRDLDIGALSRDITRGVERPQGELALAGIERVGDDGDHSDGAFHDADRERAPLAIVHLVLHALDR